MFQNLRELSHAAAEYILSHPKTSRIRVVSHYDADGITAAFIVCKAVYRKGYDFHLSLMRNPFIEGLERVKKEGNELTIFTDMGSGQIETIESFKGKKIIVDHHQYIKKESGKDLLQINANLCGVNGSYEACGATLSYYVAKALDQKNEDLAPFALIGAMGDKQYIGGLRGLNKEILEETVGKKMLDKKTDIKLPGENIYEALYYSADPYYTNLSGREEEINKLLKKLKINPRTKTRDLKKQEKKQLNSYLMLKLIKNNCEKNIIDTVIRERYWLKQLNIELERFADILDFCGKGGKRGLAFAVCQGDKEALAEALQNEREYKEKVLEKLKKLDEKGAEEKENFRFFYCENSSMAGVIAGVAINYIFDKEKPLVSIVCKNEELHISSRGNQYLVKKGLDLGAAMREISKKTGGHGGGHNIAAGATIPLNKKEEFLQQLDIILSKQFKS